jgi:hypothetical protein
VASQIDLYSASVDEREIVGCFLERQEITLSLNQTTHPEIDLLDSGQLAQSASA